MSNRSGLLAMGHNVWRLGVCYFAFQMKITKAKELIEPLRQGLHNLKSEPERYKKFNPENGWGSYDGLVKFVENYLNACYEYPDADVEVSR